MRQPKWLSLFLLIPLLCEATDLKPWFGNDYEAELRATALYQNYRSVATPSHHNIKREENDAFITLSAAYPFKRYSGEFEATAAFTRHQSQCWDNFRVTGRYQWLNDNEDGDPFSLVTSLTLTEPFSRALHDISSFHHGHLEGEFDISFGKAYGCECSKDYLYRWWSVIGAGVAEEGSPWLRGDAAFEYNANGTHLFRGFVNTLWGMGGEILDPYHFRGYGKIHHESVDVGFRYGYVIDCFGTLSIQYARRVYAYNFPENANLVLIEYYCPFGSQISSSY